jgi:hypothetical protein
MGAKSSFVLFSLSHHVIVQMASLGAGIKDTFTDYVIIGDDVTIADPVVASCYKSIIESLGMDISLAKSLVHSEGLISAGEMAKRTFIGGKELSVIPPKLLARLPRFGKLGVTVQDFMTRRGASKANESLIAFIAGGMDRDSIETLVKLNSVSADIVGLHSTSGPLSDNLRISSWSDKLTLTERDVLDSYTFTVIAEQLKRLEALIRQADAITLMVSGTGKPTEAEISKLLDAPAYGKSAVEYLDPLIKEGHKHPLFLAALDEAARVGQTLAALRSGTTSLTRAAKLGLLDSLRNSVWNKVQETAEDRSQILYSVFQAALTNLSRMSDLPGVNSKGDPITRTLEFTIPILSLSRSYTVVWPLAGGVYVNMTKTRVVTDHVKATSTLKSIADSVKVLRPKVTSKR